MQYTLTLLEEQLEQLTSILFSAPEQEGAAYLLCGRSQTDSELRLLVRAVLPVEEHDYHLRTADRLSIDSASYARVAKVAARPQASILFVHSHLGSLADFSRQDNREEPKLMDFFGARSPDLPHGSVVVTSATEIRGRVWVEGHWVPFDRIRVLGQRFRFMDTANEISSIPDFLDRQVRAFGPDIQRLLGRLHVGVVGAGGTGSAVIEQLARLGVGTLSIFDGDAFDSTNSNRVYGSHLSDAQKIKADIARDHVNWMGLGTTVHAYPSHITDESTAKRLRDCDVVFGCTDRHAPRGILVRLALRYYIPVIDLGVRIDSNNGTIRSIDGRVTILMPGEACLFCRGRISTQMIGLEALSPEQWQALADEAYAPELETANPAVIPFTTGVATQAVTELLHRLTGFMGADRHSSEILLRFHETDLRTNRHPPSSTCQCADAKYWGRGDQRAFLDLSWPDAE